MVTVAVLKSKAPMGVPLEGAATSGVLERGCAGLPPSASEAGAGAAGNWASGPPGWTQNPRELMIIPSARK
eukprot:15161320-Heterocapsa_arctica.AAC.1